MNRRAGLDAFGNKQCACPARNHVDPLFHSWQPEAVERISRG